MYYLHVPIYISYRSAHGFAVSGNAEAQEGEGDPEHAGVCGLHAELHELYDAKERLVTHTAGDGAGLHIACVAQVNVSRARSGGCT